VASEQKPWKMGVFNMGEKTGMIQLGGQPEFRKLGITH